MFPCDPSAMSYAYAVEYRDLRANPAFSPAWSDWSPGQKDRDNRSVNDEPEDEEPIRNESCLLHLNAA